MNTYQNKPKTPVINNDSILESLRDIGSRVGKSVARDVPGSIANDALAALLGATPKSGELKANERIDLSQERGAPQPFRRPEMIRPQQIRVEEVGLKQQIEAVRAELKVLSASISSLNQEINRAISEVPVTPGIYHRNYFDRLRSMLTVLREQIDESRSWLALWTAKRQKKQYWGLYKKHGTQFGLSSERTAATQAG